MNKEPQKSEAATATIAQEPVGLLETVIKETNIGRDVEQKAGSRKQIATFVEEVMKGTIEKYKDKDTEAMIGARIAEIDELLTRQLNFVLHAPEFQKLEASWRGLHYLVSQTETSQSLKIRVMNASQKDILRNMESASDFDQSALFKKVYESEYGMFGGAPFGVMIGDYEFNRTSQDIALLEQLSHVAAAAHAPFLTAASPQLFNWDSFTEIDRKSVV